jgi:putative transposase
MYIWRTLTPEQREELLQFRINHHRPWHGPPTLFQEGQFHLSAACYEHKHHVGKSLQRMADFSQRLLETLEQNKAPIFAWCVLPNHYHLLTETKALWLLKKEIGKLHGRTSHEWNQEEDTVGRTVWHRCADRKIRSEGHYWATVNYIHNNPAHHGYVSNWTDWPFSSARDFIEQVGRERAITIWRDYPVLDYGKGWDDAGL